MKLAVVAASLLMTGTASANSIGLNFVDDGNGGVQNGAADALGATEVAGAPGYRRQNWNNLGRWGQTVTLNNSFGNPIGVTVTWDSNNTWRTGVGTSTGDHKLMHGYLDSTGQANWETVPYQFFWNENKPEVFIKGLSAWLAGQSGVTQYDVVVYMDGDTTGRIGEYWLQAPGDANDAPQALGSDLTSHVFVRDFGNFSGAYTQAPLSANSVANAADGNYIVFSGLSADSFILRTEERDVRAQINGMQIVPILPEFPDGDVDGDGDVDFADFEAIRDHFQMSVADRSLGDLDGDGFVDFVDFREWKANYPFPSAGAGTNAAAPEPASWILGLAAGLLSLCGHRQRRRRCRESV
ncbi:MAG: hypothetical protein WD738_07920 [Pirellulales bacterium]